MAAYLTIREGPEKGKRFPLHCGRAMQRLITYAWPGNIRQLRNVVDSAVVMVDDPLIRRALAQTDGSVPSAAKLLGISRATAHRKIADYGIDR